MSIEIGELIIQTQVVTQPSSASQGALSRLAGGLARDEEAVVIDEIVRRVIEQLRMQWRGRP